VGRALVLGLLHWFANISFLYAHMLFGLTVTLALLALSIYRVALYQRSEDSWSAGHHLHAYRTNTWYESVYAPHW
jgi:hypothetical protein